MQEWVPLLKFPNYSVSMTGEILSHKTDEVIAPCLNTRGLPYVQLFSEGRRHNLSVARIVAETFLVPPQYSAFDTPINLNGDRLDNCVNNLAWRPLWFARKYHKQFSRPQTYADVVRVVDTGEEFMGSLAAAVRYGVLENEVWHDGWYYTVNHIEKYTWPVLIQFELPRWGLHTL